jgi:SAM-dependent methyltransferase
MSARSRDLLQTAVVVAIFLTPAWLTPGWFAAPWAIVVLLVAVPALWLSWTHAPFVPTPPAERARILRLLDLKPGTVFCDLGAGDGRMVVDAARAGADSFGVELNPLLWAIGRLRVGLSGGRMQLGDLYGADLRAVDVVYVWGTPYGLHSERFTRFLLDQLPPGARVVSYHTPLEGLGPGTCEGSGERPVWMYGLPQTP